MPSFKRGRSAFSLLELTVTTALFAVITTLLFALLNEGFQRWRFVNARFDAQQRLNRSLSWLTRDLEKADANQVRVKRVNAPGNGDMLWFLSADDPTQTSADSRFIRDPASGLPEWQRHIVYYLIRPSDYSRVSKGYTPGIDADPRNDYYAPHKFLIRKVVDDPSTPETLMNAATADGYVTAPAAHDLSLLAAEPRVDQCKLVADGLLSFEATLYDRTIEFDVRAVHIGNAERVVSIGSVSLKNSRFTIHQRIRVVMKQ